MSGARNDGAAMTAIACAIDEFCVFGFFLVVRGRVALALVLEVGWSQADERLSGRPPRGHVGSWWVEVCTTKVNVCWWTDCAREIGQEVRFFFFFGVANGR